MFFLAPLSKTRMSPQDGGQQPAGVFYERPHRMLLEAEHNDDNATETDTFQPKA